MKRAMNQTAWLGMWGTIAVVIFACATGSTPIGWFARGGLEHALVGRELRHASVQHLAVIADALPRYRARFGRRPAGLADLQRAPVSKGILESPLGGRYVLTGRAMGQGRGPVCRELGVPGGGGHVLFADGRIDWMECP